MRAKANIATEVRDSIESLCTPPQIYTKFLTKLWPVFKKILEGKPDFSPTSSEHNLRNQVLEILHRLQHGSAEIEPFAVDIVELLMELVRVENEDNAVLCLKTIMDLERHQASATASKVQPFLDLIQEMFEMMEQVVRDTFDNPAAHTGASSSTPNAGGQTLQSPRPGSPATTVSDPGTEKKEQVPLAKGMQSFKVLSECPIIVVSIFQAHRNTVSVNVKKFVPSIKGILLLQAKAQERAHTEAASRNTIFTGVSKEIKNRVAFGDFITAQVKTMSFLAYLLRVYANQLSDFLPTLPGVVVRLLKDCPREKSSARKELLVAIRHIINFNYRKIFLNKIDDMLDERILIGDGLTVYETMRPLAYSMLADLIHHVRESLSRDQIRRTIEVYTRNLHDNFPGTSFQTMSAKLLLNMAESITKLDDKEDARHFLVMILDAIGDKFAAMNYQYTNAVKLSRLYSDKSKENQPEQYLDDKDQIPDWDEVDIFNATPIKTSNPRDRGADPVADNKFLFKNLVNGLKNMFYQLKNCNPSGVNIDPAIVPANWAEISFGYNAEEVNVVTKLFHEGARVFRYYSTDPPPTESPVSSPVDSMASHSMAQMSREEKELLESFGTVFHCLDPATFHEVFQSEIPHLHDLMFEHTALLHLPQFFLASETTSPAFAGMVLQYLMNKLPEVGSSDIKKSSILLRMFKLSFMAVTLFSQHNEQVLHPHITKIVTQCVHLSVSAEKPIHYFILLRSLFRSIGGGRFELLYKEILPLLEMLLETFNHLLQGARDVHDRDLYVELTLTVPARLSHLLPHLSHLMRPLVVALRAGPDLVGQGLRTLELCVDNLTADYLDPIMAPIMDDLMTALFEHLKPQPYQHFHSHTTMRILGKLGGRNRKFLNHLHQLSPRGCTDDETSFDIRLVGTNKDRAFATSTGVDLAIKRLSDSSRPGNAKSQALDLYYKQQSFKFLTNQVKLFVGFDHLPDDFAALLRLQANDMVQRRFETYADMLSGSDQMKSVQKRRDEEDIMKKLIKACVVATTVAEIKSDAETFITSLARHFTIVELGQALCDSGRKTKEFDVNLGEGLVYLNTRLFADVLSDSFASENAVIREAAEAALFTIRDTAKAIFGNIEKAARLPFFSHITQTFCHKCREPEWFSKAGAALGLQLIVTKLGLGNGFLASKHLDIIKALLFVIKDTPQDVPSSTRLTAQETLQFILKKVCHGSSKDTIGNEKSHIHLLSVSLCVELSHMNKHVREAAQQAFSIMAEELGVEVSEMLVPVKERLLQPIFNKPLRALPFLSQTGFIDAITYCLSLGHDLVPLNDQLNRLTMESLALADADAEVLHPKPDEYSNAELIVNLRVSCLKLLSMAMSLPEFAAAPQNTSRARIITVLFKLLYSKSKDVIEAANAGLKEVLTQTGKLPKDLLQNGLRPILMNLQDPKRLSVAGLDGLARLLTLLTNYFKVEIGSRLLEHMKNIADEQLLQKVSFGLIEQNPQMKIVAAILNIFHLLPAAATQFMAELVNGVLDLEAKLRRTTSSPFRHPLVLYLNKYPSESFTFFKEKIQEEKYGRFFSQILMDPLSEPLREAVMSDADALSSAMLDSIPEEAKITALINGTQLLRSACTSDKCSAWIQGQKTLLRRLLEAGKEFYGKLRKDELQHSQRLRAEQAGDALLDVLLAYLAAAPGDLDFMMEVFSACADAQIKTSLRLTKYLFKELVTHPSAMVQRNIIERCLDVYSQKISSQKTKTFLLHNVVNPTLAYDVQRIRKTSQRDPPLMEKSVYDLVHDRLWKSPAAEFGDDAAQPGIDHTRMEILQLSAFMIKYHKDAVSEARKDIIKFAWSYIRLEDVINKYAAYVLICYFIRSYETPTKIAAQIYNQLLKAHQNEGKTLVTQALEVLAPILPVRMAQPNATPGDKRSPTWARLPRKILSEETGNLQQIQSIFNFIVRQPDLFFESREFFIPVIIQTLHKIASPPNPSNESKKLALSLVSLICQWEQKRVNPESPSQSPSEVSKKRDASGSQVSASTTKDRGEYLIPTELRTVVIKYMITFITSLQERYPLPSADMKLKTMQKAQQQLMSNEMCKKAVQLLHDLLAPGLWADVDVSLYEKLLDPVLAGEKADKPDDKHLISMINALQVMRILLSTKTNDWILAHMETVQKLLEKPLKMEDPEIHDCLHYVDTELGTRPLLRQVLEAIPEGKADDDDAMEIDGPPLDFITKLSKTIIADALTSGNLISAVNDLWTMANVRPVEVDEHIAGLMRVFQGKLAKEHVSAFMLPPGPPPQGWRVGDPVMDPYEFALGVDLMKKAIDILSARMASLSDQRRPFLSVLASLVEKSFNTDLCNKILDMVEQWVFDSSEAWPTLKEKTAVLHKMLVFEKWPNQSLLERFLELVIKIYEDPTVTRTELTVRLEHAFLIGTRAKDVEMRSRFMNIFNKALSQTASYRLSYVLTLQNWDTLADSFWLKQASHLILGAVDMSMPARLHPEDITVCPVSKLFSPALVNPEQKKDDLMIDDELEGIVNAQRRFVQDVSDVKVRDLLEPLIQLQHTDDHVAYDVWVKLFPLCWSALTRDERVDLEKGMVTLLTREYHQRQLNLRPNVVQALLEGAVRAKPRFKVPPHVLKFLSRTYDAWYTGLIALEESTIDPLIDTTQVRESNLDALVEVYAGLQEDDLFYGTWRRRCKFMETNSALSYEQHGMWDKAQQLWEAAQVKARTGVMPFSQGEYYLWEDHWMICAQKLQQWDILGEFAKHENFNDLLLESAWRNYEAWSGDENRGQLDGMIKSVSDAPTPRRTFFQAFMSLLKYNSKQISRAEFQHVCDEAIQLSIRKWHQLPKRITNAHIPILQNFQQLVELHDGSVICDSLMGTNERNLDSKSQEVKLLLQAWRDRLPNVWDDINAWQDLVTWRQHVFQLVNSTYLPLLPQGGNNVGNNSYAFRGYHETAWIINKFAHVARKHQMPDVCINQLGKIYTLPNIEIQEAFLKLREQAKCHYQNKAELNNGLDVINNTNLNYFGAQQKAEFYTLKGMFLAKLQHAEEANEAFGVALYYDLRLPKAWAEWGQYSDRKFKENPTNIEAASNAVSCYLEAAGLYKSAKSRKMLSRVLWLLSLDDEEGHIAKAFEEFKGETPVWYWTTFIPQLLGSLEHKEARLAKSVLAKIAKAFPQSLFYHLRATREDFSLKRKQQEQRPGSKQGSAQRESESSGSRPGTANGEPSTNGEKAGSGSPKPKQEANGDSQPEQVKRETPKRPLDYANEIMDGLKTGFPLLALSMETMTDQLSKHFKCPPDEDAHRLIVALLNDGLTYINRAPANYAEGAKLPPSTEVNISRFVASVLPAHIRKSFEADFVQTKPTMYEYIHKLRRWRDKFENKLDHRQQWAPLESYSHSLSEFKFLKFDESVEVPGQYQQHKDKNSDFIRIERFMPSVELVRGNNICHRRLTIRGHDGSLHPFAVQHPTGGKVRREERIVQLFRIFNQTLFKRKEARRRNLYFHLPIFVPIAPHIRLVQDDASYVTLQTIYEDFLRKATPAMSRDDPMLFLLEKSRAVAEQQKSTPRTADQLTIMKTEIFNTIQERWVPNTIALDYFKTIYTSYADFWLFRRQFAYQYAATTFMTYVMHMSGRYPIKISISKDTGDIWSSDLLPNLNSAKAYFYNPEAVPFRLSPNIQTLIGPLALEGIFTASLMAIARCLAEQDGGVEMSNWLSIFVKDEVMNWSAGRQSGEQKMEGNHLRELVQQNSEFIVRKAMSLAKTQGNIPAVGGGGEGAGGGVGPGVLPACQNSLDLIVRATDPTKLASMDGLWMPWL